MVTIREMTDEDVDDVVPLEVEVAERSYRDDAALGADHHEGRIRSALGRRWDHLYVAERDGEVVGFGWLSQQKNRATDERYGMVKSLAVAEDARGRGVGREILDRLEARARELDHARLRLIVGADNRDAIAFYEDAGFAARTRLLEKPLGDDGG